MKNKINFALLQISKATDQALRYYCAIANLKETLRTLLYLSTTPPIYLFTEQRTAAAMQNKLKMEDDPLFKFIYKGLEMPFRCSGVRSKTFR